MLTPVLSSLHATEQHVYCSEHGAFEEGSDAQTSTGSAGPSTVSRAPVRGAGTHEECRLACAHAGETVSPEGAPLATKAPQTPDPQALPTDRAPAPAVALLSTAPKNSPPRSV
jgi:hypothetical protein